MRESLERLSFRIKANIEQEFAQESQRKFC